MVLPDDGKTRFPSMTMKGIVTADPAQMLGALVEIGAVLPMSTTDLSGPIRLMSAALMEHQYAAKLVLAISAVEALGQNETWSASQRDLLKDLAEQAASTGKGEDREVAEAILRGTHKIGLRQGVLRLLKRLNLYDLRHEWDRIYELRSGLVHGTAPQTEPETAALANDAVTLCGRVVVENARHMGLPVATIADTHYVVAGTEMPQSANLSRVAGEGTTRSVVEGAAKSAEV